MVEHKKGEFSYAGWTQKGLWRKRNEDAILMLAEERLFVVADGMGGHPGGDVASRMAVDKIAEFYARYPLDHAMFSDPSSKSVDMVPEVARLLEAIEHAHREIKRKAAANSELRDMGTTVAAVCLVDSVVVSTNVGDSLCYLLTADEIFRLSDWHVTQTWASDEEMREAGLPLSGPRKVRQRLTQFLGNEERERVYAQIRAGYSMAGDTIVICSDGVHEHLRSSGVESVLKLHNDPETICHLLVERALEAGGKDDMSVIAVRQDREFVPFEAPAHFEEGTKPMQRFEPILRYHNWRTSNR